jgi:hypothetical protein
LLLYLVLFQLPQWSKDAGEPVPRVIRVASDRSPDASAPAIRPYSELATATQAQSLPAPVREGQAESSPNLPLATVRSEDGTAAADVTHAESDAQIEALADPSAVAAAALISPAAPSQHQRSDGGALATATPASQSLSAPVREGQEESSPNLPVAAVRNEQGTAAADVTHAESDAQIEAVADPSEAAAAALISAAAPSQEQRSDEGALAAATPTSQSLSAPVREDQAESSPNLPLATVRSEDGTAGADVAHAESGVQIDAVAEPSAAAAAALISPAAPSLHVERLGPAPPMPGVIVQPPVDHSLVRTPDPSGGQLRIGRAPQRARVRAPSERAPNEGTTRPGCARAAGRTTT